jgi:hypothetical protein
LTVDPEMLLFLSHWFACAREMGGQQMHGMQDPGLLHSIASFPFLQHARGQPSCQRYHHP